MLCSLCLCFAEPDIFASFRGSKCNVLFVLYYYAWTPCATHNIGSRYELPPFLLPPSSSSSAFRRRRRRRLGCLVRWLLPPFVLLFRSSSSALRRRRLDLNLDFVSSRTFAVVVVVVGVFAVVVVNL